VQVSLDNEYEELGRCNWIWR